MLWFGYRGSRDAGGITAPELPACQWIPTGFWRVREGLRSCATSRATAPLGRGGLLELDELPLEIGDPLEALVDRGEAQVRDRVEDPEALEDGPPDPLGRDLGAGGPGLLLALEREQPDRGPVDGAAVDGPLEAGGVLRRVERLA